MKEALVNLVATNYVTIISAVLLGLVLALLWMRGNKPFVKSVVLELVARADQQFGSGTGKIKFAMVYNRLPLWIRLVFTQEEIQVFIKEACTWIKAEIKGEGKNLLSLSDELAVKLLPTLSETVIPAVEVAEETIPVINSVPPDVDLFPAVEAEQPITVTPVTTVSDPVAIAQTYDRCGSCQGKYLTGFCIGCNGENKYIAQG